MKAIQVQEFGGPEVMKVKDIPVPNPRTGEVLVKIHAAGVNPVDTYIRSGSYGIKPGLPYVPGFDAAGTIEKAGPAVGYKPGTRVYCSGTITGSYAEYALCEVAQVHPLPSHVGFAEGAAVSVPYATAYRALFQRAQARPGESVLVHGASGGVGIAAVQLARAAGLSVIGTAGSERGRKLVQEMGAHFVADHTRSGYLNEIQQMTLNKGVDVILEMLANVNLNNDLGLLAHGGRVVVIGSRGKVEIDPRTAMGKDASILGMLLMVVPELDRLAIHSAIVAGLENRTLRPVVGREMPLADAAKAHAAVLEPGAYGKIVLIP